MHRDYPIATEVIMEQIKRTRFWFVAFVVTLVVSITREAVRVMKGGENQ